MEEQRVGPHHTSLHLRGKWQHVTDYMTLQQHPPPSFLFCHPCAIAGETGVTSSPSVSFLSRPHVSHTPGKSEGGKDQEPRQIDTDPLCTLSSCASPE